MSMIEIDQTMSLYYRSIYLETLMKIMETGGYYLR
jgi:hypothetical protein